MPCWLPDSFHISMSTLKLVSGLRVNYMNKCGPFSLVSELCGAGALGLALVLRWLCYWGKILLTAPCQVIALFFLSIPTGTQGLPWWICLEGKRHWFGPWVGKIPWRRKWQPSPAHLPGGARRRRSLVGESVGSQEPDRTCSCVCSRGVSLPLRASSQAHVGCHSAPLSRAVFDFAVLSWQKFCFL